MDSKTSGAAPCLKASTDNSKFEIHEYCSHNLRERPVTVELGVEVVDGSVIGASVAVASVEVYVVVD